MLAFVHNALILIKGMSFDQYLKGSTPKPKKPLEIKERRKKNREKQYEKIPSGKTLVKVQEPKTEG
jgi:hypothetical protein